MSDSRVIAEAADALMKHSTIAQLHRTEVDMLDIVLQELRAELIERLKERKG